MMVGKSFQYMLTVIIQGADVFVDSVVVGCVGFCSIVGLFFIGGFGKSFNSDSNKFREDFLVGMVDSFEKVFFVVIAVLLVVVVGVVIVLAEKFFLDLFGFELKFFLEFFVENSLVVL